MAGGTKINIFKNIYPGDKLTGISKFKNLYEKKTGKIIDQTI